MKKRYRGITKQAINIRYIYFFIYLLSLLFSENKVYAEVKDIDYANVIKIERENKDSLKTVSENLFENVNSTVSSFKSLENVNIGSEQGEVTLNLQRQSISNIPHNSLYTRPLLTLNNPYEENNKFSSSYNISSRLADMGVTGKESLILSESFNTIQNLQIRETGELTISRSLNGGGLTVRNFFSSNGKLIINKNERNGNFVFYFDSFSGNLLLLKVIGNGDVAGGHSFTVSTVTSNKPITIHAINLELENVKLDFGNAVTLLVDNLIVRNKVSIDEYTIYDHLLSTKNLNIEGGQLQIASNLEFSILENLSFTGISTLDLKNNIKETKNLNIEGNATISGTGSLNITENVNLKGTSTLSLNNNITTKNLNVEGRAILLGNMSLSIAENINIKNNSSLTLNNSLETKGIRLAEDTTLAVNGLLDVGDGGIDVEGISTINIDSTINTSSIDISKNGALKISGTGNINVGDGLININEGVLDLTNTRTDMLQNIWVDNISGVLEVGTNQLNLKKYKGNIDSQINIKLADSMSGKLNLSNSFQVTDGIFNINTEGLTNYQEGTRYEILTANSIDLQGDNIFVSDNVKYQLIHEIIDGKAIEVSFTKTNISCTTGEGSDYCNIATNLQNTIDNGLGNEKFNKDLSVIIADTQNREYNILQLKPISNTTKKEINSIISGEFNNLVMDRMYNSNLRRTKKIKNSASVFNNQSSSISTFDRLSVRKSSNSNSTEGLNMWSSLGHSIATIKGESLGGLKEGKEGIQTNQVAIGINYATENTLIGIAGSFGSISSKNKEEIERYQIKGRSYSGGIYVGYKEEYFYINNNVSYTTINNDSIRYIDMPLNPKENQAVSRDRVISIMNESGIGDDIGSYMRFNIFVTGKYEDYTLSGYEEKGTGFALSLKDKVYKDSKVGGGIRIIGNNILNPMIEVAYERRLNKDSLKGEMSFANASSGIIEITEDTYSQDKIKVRAGINIDIEYVGNETLSFGVRVQQEFNKEVSNFSGSANINYNF